ncbi:nucleotide-binding universal stress UspA family protein [Paraburkholderia bannensis]|uniref:Nucleotide-binding universal stress UspA family protein n=1 Tax=Paraburkholderia bannensis TaxID=765414 RepID=A0A7W9U6L4_9BURK|nr:MULTISPECIES: universal stress protein [Paraburkholderia]MBB3261915.1 nucleotide-binding universal stress UspA family protein [Paraburkholderia sp. WP4_3_2]MBB6106910.1 nucleotide-binding universal stress UspA family protein [Paraburkholderia bannensis]
MYEKIELAYDGSETSKQALTEALKIALLCGAQLRIAYVLDVVSPMSVGMDLTYMPAEVIDAYREDALAMLEAAGSEAKTAGVRCETRLLEVQDMSDGVAQCLEREASSYGAQLVVLGTHGRRGVKRALLGSVAEQFVRIAQCPVLLVRV